ncbi:MAG: hypothetical protein ACKO0Z_14405, partial [Betaproteobacteria bacterium]
MRIVIDLQGAQTESRFRGIGRYSLSLSLAIARQRGEHEVIIALNGLFPETIAPIRQAFDGILPQKNIVVWDAVGPAYELHPDNALRRAISEKIREAFLVALEPDVVLVTSLFEGYGDDAITTIGRFDGSIPTAVILYDLIPLISPDEHFLGNQILRTYYAGKIESLKQSRLLLAISERARLEALTSLQFDQDSSRQGRPDDRLEMLRGDPVRLRAERRAARKQHAGSEARRRRVDDLQVAVDDK